MVKPTCLLALASFNSNPTLRTVWGWNVCGTRARLGTPVQYFLERGASTPTLYLYPTPDNAHTLKYYGLTKIQDAGDYNDQLEVPTRFIPCLSSGLAYYMSVKKAPERTPLLKQLYEEEWQRASEEDRPRSSFFATPDIGYM